MAPTTTAPSVVVNLTRYSAFKTKFTKLDVEYTGKFAAVANSNVVLVYDLEQRDKGHDIFPYKPGQERVNAIKWNPHHNRRMHLASAKGQEVIIWDLEARGSSSAETKRAHACEVTDVCWSPIEENTVVSAGHSILSWDTRVQNRVQELKVGMGTTQVSFNRKNPHILASASMHTNQVWIWDMRCEQKPVFKFSAHLTGGGTVTSIDWSYESEYDLLTSGGGDKQIKLWNVGTAKAEQLPSPGSTAVDPEDGMRMLQDRCLLEQPAKKVLFAPVGQGAITMSWGELERFCELQTVKMWSLEQTRRFEKINTFQAGKDRILGLSWRARGDGGYQVASLDHADHLRLHDIEEPSHGGSGVDLPAGESSAGRGYGSTAGSESLEGATTSKTSMIRDDLVPVVWSFSKLASAASSKIAGDMVKATGHNPTRELIEVERGAIRGVFGPVSDVRLHMAQNVVILIMIASAEASPPFSAPMAQQRASGGLSGSSDAASGNTPGASGAVTYIATARLQVTAKLPPASRSRDELAAVQLESKGGSVRVQPHHAGVMLPTLVPLDEGTVKRLQVAAEDAMRRALKLRKPRLEACLLKLRRELTERVRNVANQAAGLVPRRDELYVDQHAGLQFPLDEPRPAPSDYPSGGKFDEVLSSADMDPSLSTDPIVPCPRRFGATFAANGTLVVFCSSLVVVRAGKDDGRKRHGGNRKQASTGYPRTYASFLDCLQNIQKFDIDEESQGDEVHQPHFDESMRDDENRSWFRSSWGLAQGPDTAWDDRDDDSYGVSRYSTEESLIEEETQALTPYSQGDNTRLPISHPDHSLGAGLGSLSDTDNDVVEGDAEEDTAVVTDSPGKGELPWTPKPKQVVLVDCSWFLPGSPYLAAFYKLGPCRQPTRQETDALPAAWKDAADTQDETVFTGPGHVDFKPDSDPPASSGGRPRRGSIIGLVSGMPTSFTGLHRSGSLAQDIGGRGLGNSRRSTGEDVQTAPPTLGKQKQWESTPDFKVLRANARGGGSSSRGGWVIPTAPGAAKSPAVVGGSPGRSELVRATNRPISRGSSVDEMVFGSPYQHYLLPELTDVAELSHREPDASVTPPRSTALTEDGSVFSLAEGVGGVGDAGVPSPGTTLGLKSSAQQSRNYHRPRKWPGKIMRQNGPFPRSPGSAGGPSPPLDTPRLRLGASTPASPADAAGPTSNSPPMSDFGMELAQPSTSGALTGSAAALHGVGSRSSSFSAGSGKGLFTQEEPSVGDTAFAAQLGPGDIGKNLGPSGDYPALESADTGFVPGARSRSGTEIWRNSLQSSASCGADELPEISSGDGESSVGHLSRHNAAVATGDGSRELASVWALMADAADKDVFAGKDHPGQESVGVRAQAVWKSTGPRLIERIFRHYETIGDPQMLASMACVLGSASGPDACLGIVPKGQDSMATYDRYMTSYAERLYQWGALGTRTEIVNHQSETIQQPPDMQIHGRPSSSEHAAPPPLCEGGGHKRQGRMDCSLCGTPVRGEHLACGFCGHGGHALHMESWYAQETECPRLGCRCHCVVKLVKAWEDGR